jgi:hypothetical protein
MRFRSRDPAPRAIDMCTPRKIPALTLPKIVREVRPQYTQEAMDAHIEGSVQLALTIEADGSVSDVQITESLDPTFGLDDQAVRRPGSGSSARRTKDGHPVAVESTCNSNSR